MNIAIVAPSPVPFMVGGAENLGWGLLEAIRSGTPHRVELIKLPAREQSFWEVIDSYRAFSQLDLGHFDQVVSLKYPAWMVQHPNHVCYMLHPLRGLYDSYHYFGLPEQLEESSGVLGELRRLMADNPGRREILPELFARLEALRSATDLPPDLFRFPGPLIREIVHHLDGIGLATTAVRKYAAISQTVAGRKDYFPPGVPVRVAHPPSHLTRFKSGRDEYLFTVSRLDGPKRVALLVEAMSYVRAPIELRIAGTGPEEARIKSLAGSDPRIKFLGFVNDSDVLGLYANALAVPFIPLEEDYGLVTVEAMMSGKPVITLTDSGGPNELVQDGETGYSVAPDARALAAKIDYLCEHRDLARSMGLKAQRRAQAITWEAVVGALLDEGDRKQSFKPPPKRKQLTVALTFPVYPPRGGGQSRVFHLYRHLARFVDVELVSITGADQPAFDGEIAPNLREIRIPKSAEHQRREHEIEAELHLPLTDVVMPRLQHLTPDYLSALRRSSDSAAVVIASHPYTYPALREVTGKPLWYEAHNVESELKRAMLPKGPAARRLLDDITQVERTCCEASELIFACSAEDAITLQRLYGANPARMVEVPNGVDLQSVRFVPPRERLEVKARLGLSSEVLALFVGSWHGPNLDAVREIFDFAARCPRVSFLILGSSCAAFEQQARPPNVGLLGVVDDEAKDALLGLADLALNPVVSGSGTNLKMLDYFASGLPVVSTPHGARGLRVRDGEQLVLAELGQFPEAIARVTAEAAATREARIESAHRLAEESYAWPVIASRFWSELTQKGLL